LFVEYRDKKLRSSLRFVSFIPLLGRPELLPARNHSPGIGSNTRRAARRREDLARCRELLGAPPPPATKKDASWLVAFERLFGTNPLLCPVCKTGVLVATRVLPPIRA
jgi:hypothetical protein